MKTMLRIPVCGQTFPDGECVNGNVEALTEARTIVRRCACRDLATPAKAKAQGLAKAATNEASLAAARKIVEDVAQQFELFSANECREKIAASGIDPQGVMGKAFLELRDAGWIEPTDQTVRSTDPGTHGKRITVWRSLYGRRNAFEFPPTPGKRAS